jgi:predicted Zn-dependent protease with MMP-like domain
VVRCFLGIEEDHGRETIEMRTEYLFDRLRNFSMGGVRFEKLVKESVLELPEKIRQKMENVALCVEKKPTPEQLRKLGVRSGGCLLGLYEGVPKTAYGRGFGMILPDKITIFQEAIEKFARTPQAIKELVRNVVWHEVAHHFGFNERQIRELEKKRRK